MRIYWSAIKIYKPGMTIQSHSHKFQQILMVKSGLFEFIVNGRKIIIGKNSLIGIPKNFIHSYRCIKQGNILDFKLNIIEDEQVEFSTFFTKQLDAGFELMILSQIYENISNDVYNKKHENILIKSLDLILTLLTETKNDTNDIPVLTTKILVSNSLVNNIIRYFDDNFLTNPKMSDIADIFNISNHEMDKLFVHEIGISPKKLLLNIRLEYARNRLTEEDSITYVANEIDMSLPHFSKMFKQKYGLSPKTYQKNYFSNKIDLVFSSEFDISAEPK